MRIFKGWIVRVPFAEADGYPGGWEWVCDEHNNTTTRREAALVFESPTEAYEKTSEEWEDVCLMPVYEGEK